MNGHIPNLLMYDSKYIEKYFNHKVFLWKENLICKITPKSQASYKLDRYIKLTRLNKYLIPHLT